MKHNIVPILIFVASVLIGSAIWIALVVGYMSFVVSMMKG